MEPSSFTITIPRHVDAKQRNYWLEWLREKGAEVESVNEDTYRVSCYRTRQLEYVGWALYHTALAKLSVVLEVSGAAEARASAYSRPTPKD